MKITGLEVVPFETFVDRISFGQLMTDHRVVQTVTKVRTDEGVEGYYFGGHFHGDQDGLLPGDRAIITEFLSPLLAGQDPFDRAEIWRQLWAAKLPENVCRVIDLALWDLAGRVAGLPVRKLLGGARDRVKAYASSFNNLGSPDEYAAHAVECKRQGYGAYKIHPYHYWNPATREPALPRPSYVDWDIRVCREVRAAVGDDMVLMFDPWGTYLTYEDALRVGRELQRLGFCWYEHPRPEYRVESDAKLAANSTSRSAHPRAPRAASTPGRNGSCATPPTSAASTCFAGASPA
jgi:L-alanine-DL-glutamate epimerase-like enolase superfamily enzyme